MGSMPHPRFAWSGRDLAGVSGTGLCLGAPGLSRLLRILNGYSPIFNLNDLVHHGLDVSWMPAIGQPYDLWRGERLLPYLLAFLVHTLGFSDVASVKWVLFASILGGSLGMYGWARRRLGAWSGLLAATVFTFWPLGLATIYVRGAFAEAIFLGILPWVWWAAEAGGAQSGWWAPAGLALAIAAAFLTQPGLALWLVAGLVAFVLLNRRAGSGDGRACRMDRWHCRWTSRPLARLAYSWASQPDLRSFHGALSIPLPVASGGLGFYAWRRRGHMTRCHFNSVWLPVVWPLWVSSWRRGSTSTYGVRSPLIRRLSARVLGYASQVPSYFSRSLSA